MPKTKLESVSSIESLNHKLLNDRLRVHRRQSQRATPFNLLALIDMAFIALLFGFLFTRFVVMPGVEINLLKTDLKMKPASSQIVVLTIENKETIFFDGGIYTLNTIGAAFVNYIKSEGASLDHNLLIRSDSQMDLESFLKLCSMAEQAGFPKVQVMGQAADGNALFQ
tara:strand:+ start:304 stop:807 length:504 start_codon:yes stop_codon:yes gene_type:complete